jgi:CBS domain-containing protein
MKLSQVMTGGLETVAPQASLSEAAAKMANRDVGSLPVTAGARIIGIITDRDITVRAVACGLDPNATKVEEVMTREVLSCPADADVRAAMQLMEERQVRRLVVTDGEAPVGIVSLGDLALCMRAHDSGEVLKRVSEPH